MELINQVIALYSDVKRNLDRLRPLYAANLERLDPEVKSNVQFIIKDAGDALSESRKVLSAQGVDTNDLEGIPFYFAGALLAGGLVAATYLGHESLQRIKEWLYIEKMKTQQAINMIEAGARPEAVDRFLDATRIRVPGERVAAPLSLATIAIVGAGLYLAWKYMGK